MVCRRKIKRQRNLCLFLTHQHIIDESCIQKNKDRCLKLSYIMGLGKTTGGKTSIIGYIISQKKSFVNILFENFKNG